MNYMISIVEARTIETLSSFFFIVSSSFLYREKSKYAFEKADQNGARYRQQLRNNTVEKAIIRTCINREILFVALSGLN